MASIRYLRQTLKDIIAPRIFAWLEYKGGKYVGEPLNGQIGRQAIVGRIIVTCQIEQIVETGSHRGDTTEWFAGFGLPTRTVEIGSTFAQFARLRLQHLPNVYVEKGDSVQFLLQFAQSRASERRTLFYLDAYWLKHLPLADELRIIAQSFQSSVVMVDDFQVPDDKGYGFDGRGDQSLTLGYLARNDLTQFGVFFPALLSAEETGARRGCVVLGLGETVGELESISLLRRWARPTDWELGR